MLEPQSRAALTDLLRPPAGFDLSHGVGTTFTLDLATALMIPLSLSSSRSPATGDVLGILDAVRRVADRIDVFAQAGAVSMGAPSDLVVFLESSIHPVVHPRGLFHPKVWFLEYQQDDERRYRFVCASRNLTGDRSWDVVVSLDGIPAEPSPELAEQNAPLVALLNHLPELAVRPLEPERIDRIHALAGRFASIDWERPPHTHEVTFHVLGLPGSALPDLSGLRSLVISPFVSDDGLALLREGVRDQTHVISRPSTLDQLNPASFDGRLTTSVLDEAAELHDDDVETDGRPAVDSLAGLHAKVVVIDRSYRSHVLLGSANATGAAWNRNIEVMVELEAKTAQLGVAATLEALGGLVQPYAASGGEEPDPDEEGVLPLERFLQSIAAHPFTVQVLPEGQVANASETPSPHRDLRVWTTAPPSTHPKISLHWSLLTRSDIGQSGLPGPTPDHAAHLPDVDLHDITPFLRITVQDSAGNRRSTIVVADLTGDVEDRREAIIARHLTDRASFIRLLTLMLSLSGTLITPTEDAGSGDTTAPWSSQNGAGLFESLVRVVGDPHGNLDDVHRIIEFVRRHNDAAAVLPEGFDVLWDRVWGAHQQLTKCSPAGSPANPAHQEANHG